MPETLDRVKKALAGQYEVVREVGRGGMATVYLARDAKHDRQVAVKILHPELTAVLGPDRFLNEIRIAAKLNHPHILPLHDSGQADRFLFYVMPFIEGDSLRAKLTRERQLPIDTAVMIARQVASALDYAHRHDIVHRDIKPENIMLQEGEAMVADFGIAVAVHAAGGERLTETGLSLGTPEYMSPEQASGDRHLDARSDIYSLGSVLYEMLSGEAPYTGPTVQSIVAKVLTEPPRNIRIARDTVPEIIERATMKALAKLPADRFATAAELAEVLSSSMSATTITTGQPSAVPYNRPSLAIRAARRFKWRFVPWLVAGAALIVAALMMVQTQRTPASTGALTRLVIPLPPTQELVGGPSSPITISPDGTQLVYAANENGGSRLYLRALDAFAAQPITGSEGAIAPFFSPNGGWVGFFADGKLMKVSVSGGTPLTITEAPWSASFGFAASWGSDDNIVFAPGLIFGLWQVSASGGAAEQITNPDTDAGEIGHGWPQVLPGGNEVLFTIAQREGRRVAVMSLASGETRTVLENRSDATGTRHLPTGYLIFAQDGALLGMPNRRLSSVASGPPVSILDGIYTFGSGLPYFTVSGNGSLVYAPGGAITAQNTLVLVDREGNATPLATEPGVYLYPRFSPDGRRIAVNVENLGTRDVLVFDLDRSTRTRVTVEGSNSDPIWTPDGRYITFASNRAGPFNLYRKSADGSGVAELLLMRELSQFPHSWTPDGNTLAFYELSQTAARNIWLLELGGDTTTSELLATPFNERSPMFSPDGKWLAYTSNESGRDEVYVRPYPSGDRRILISPEGGREPTWAADGRRLFYRHGDRLMEVAVDPEPTFEAAQPQLLFEGQYEPVAMSSGSDNYDVSPDGQQFVMIRRSEESLPSQLFVVLNWFDDVARLISERGGGD